MCAAESADQDLMKAPITLIETVTTEKYGQNIRCISGAYLGDGRLIMADDKTNRLLELDDKYNIVKEYKMDSPPFSVAAGHEDNEAYVAMNKRYLYKYTFGSDGTEIQKIPTEAGTDGVAVCGQYIAVANGVELYFIAKDGTIMKSFPQKGYFAYIATSHIHRKICYKEKYTIICRSWEGEKMFEFEDRNLREPRGICFDRSGIVYVCGSDSIYDEEYILQVSADGKESRILLKDLPYRAYNVIFHPQRNELIVTSYDANPILFGVYRLG